MIDLHVYVIRHNTLRGDEMFSTGELAKKANISRRALHYYDEIGLLKPTKIDDKNYRFYDHHALVQLQEILLLKSIGFTLDQIKQVRRRTPDITHKDHLLRSIHEQIQLVKVEKERLERKLYYLQATHHAIQVKGQANSKEIFDLIQLLEDREMKNGVVPATFNDDYFSEEEKVILEQLPVLGSDDPIINAIVKLVEQIRNNIYKSPHSNYMQKLAKQLHEINAQLFHNNESLAEKYWKKLEPKEGHSPVIYGLDPKLWKYIEEMYDHYLNQQEREQHGQ
jgi:DNA-binding transcriptional MerR regulator